VELEELQDCLIILRLGLKYCMRWYCSTPAGERREETRQNILKGVDALTILEREIAAVEAQEAQKH
jgi:hypothetical protein